MSTSRALPALHRPVRRATLPIAHLIGLWRQRRQLAMLDQHLLRDIGVTSQEAAREAARPVWDAPVDLAQMTRSCPKTRQSCAFCSD